MTASLIEDVVLANLEGLSHAYDGGWIPMDVILGAVPRARDATPYVHGFQVAYALRRLASRGLVEMRDGMWRRRG